MTSEQRYLVYNDMYMTESVSDVIQNIIERIKKFFREMHDRLTDHKVKKNVDTIKNDSELMNAEVEVPKGMKKVLNELIKKYENRIDILEDRLNDCINRDTIENAGKTDTFYSPNYREGREAAKANSYDGEYEKNLGRYAYKEPRKDVHNTPGDYKNL